MRRRGQRTRPGERQMPRRLLLALALAPALLLPVATACTNADDGGAEPTAPPGVATATPAPTTTITPAGDVLVIDGQPVRSVLIPDPGQGARYALTERALYVAESGVWVDTGTRNDGRHYLVDPTNPERLFRGDHPACGLEPDDDPEAIQLEVSEDGGRSWRRLPNGHDVRPLALDPVAPEVVYGSDCRLAISVTGGSTWRFIEGLPDFAVRDLVVDEELLVVLGTTLDGRSRIRVFDVSDPREPQQSETVVHFPGPASLDARDGRIVVGGVDMVHVSDDGGQTWTDSRIGLEAVTTTASPEAERPDAATPSDDVGILAVRIAPHDLHRLYAGTPHGLFISQDDGVTWNRYDEVPIDARVTEIEFGLDDADLYVTTDAGVIVVPAP